ncbi:Hpt domain-containing protein [Desulfocurvus sp.]|jgi:HPt (histidine-containing phosphotransfer) domain-containing protein|uniref:Hpt domain-containing protein n=1 Tax=Desulfocurvus sp. TaxID=2871698 RepID=UPI0025B87F06|nr:Hpt domain-containing protein [Desulfocurvus sp.]MCK9240779.1 Hpt domain-containing protein [Desulfocurvus sp.]
MPLDQTGVLDLEATMARLKGDRDFLLTLFRVYIDDLPAKLEALEQAAAQRELEGLLRTAHSLKGASATIGAPAMREAAERVENSARSGDLDAAVAAIPALREQALLLAHLLRQEIQKD